MTWDGVKKALQTIAPTIGGVLGGPVGGMAVTVLSQILLGKSSATPEELQHAILSMAPDQLIKLKELDYNYYLESQSQYIDALRIDADDRQDARQANLESSSWISAYLVIYSTLGLLLVAACLFFVKINPDIKDLLLMVLGGLGTKVDSTFQYYQGSSIGSKLKDLMFKEGASK